MAAGGPIQALLEAEKKQKKEMLERRNSGLAQAVARRASLHGGDMDTTMRDPVTTQKRASSSSSRASVSGTNPLIEALSRPTELSKLRKSIADKEVRQAEQADARRRSLRVGPEAVNAVLKATEAPKVDVEETEEQKQKWDHFHRRSAAFLESKEKQLEVIRRKQEQQQIQGCTFEPNADKPRRRSGHERTSSTGLYERALQAEARKEERLRKRRQEMYDKEMAQCSFAPKTDETSRSMNSVAMPRRRSFSSQGTTSTRASFTSVPGSNGMPAYAHRSSSKPGAPAMGYGAGAGAPVPTFQPPPRRGSAPVRTYNQMGFGNHNEDGPSLGDHSRMAFERACYDDNEEDEDCTTLLPPGMEEYRQQAHRNEPQTLNDLLARQTRATPAEDAASSEALSQADSASRPIANENIKALERLQNRRRLLQETLETHDTNGRGGRTAAAGSSSGVPRPPANHAARGEVCTVGLCTGCGGDLTPDSRFCGKCGTRAAAKDEGKSSHPMASVSKSVAAAVDRMEGLLLDDNDDKGSNDEIQDWLDEETDEDSEEEAFSEEYDPHDEDDEENAALEADEGASAEAPIFGRGSLLQQAPHGPVAGARGAAAFAKALGRQKHDDIPSLQMPRHLQR